MPTFEPFSFLTFLHDFLAFPLLLINFILIPYQIAFDIDADSDAIYYTIYKINFILILNILVKFRMCYYDENGFFVADSKKIMKKYIRSDFLIDFISVGFLLISRNAYLKLFFFLKTYDFLKLQEKYADFLFFSFMPKKIFSIIVFLTNLFILSHIFSCIWLRIGYYNSESSDQNWINKAQINPNYGNFDLYLISFYWIFSYFTFNSDFQKISPNQSFEYIFCIFLQIFSFFFLGFIIIHLKTIFSFEESNQALESLKKMGNNKRSLLLNDKSIKFSKYIDRSLVKPENLSLMNNLFQYTMNSENLLQILSKNQFFKENFDEEFLKKMAKIASLLQFTPGERILEVKKNLFF